MFPKSLTYDDIAIIPIFSHIESRSKFCSVITRVTKNIGLEIPIVSSPMDTVTESAMAIRLAQLGGLGFIHRFMSADAQAKEVACVRAENLKVGAALGTTDNFEERAKLCSDAGADVFVIDVAHGHHILVERALKKLKDAGFKQDFLVGSIVTSKAAEDLIKWGADGLRVGISCGSLCETATRVGVYCPQVSSIISVADIAYGAGIPVCADGGIRKPSDVAKALVLGASTVMLGSLFAATKESPGEIKKVGLWPNEELFKQYQGSASASSKSQRGEKIKNVEGNSKLIPYKGSIDRIVADIIDGVQSCMSYLDATTLDELVSNAYGNIVEVTQAGNIEGQPHLMLTKNI